MDLGGLRPQDFVEYRLVRAADQLERRFAGALEPTKLTARQFSVLAVLAAAPEITSAGLARAVLTTPQSMHTLLGQLQDRGLVDRGRVRGRGRPSPVALTADGRAVLSAAGSRVVQLENDTRERLGDADYRQLVRLLDRLEDIIGVGSGGADTPPDGPAPDGPDQGHPAADGVRTRRASPAPRGAGRSAGPGAG